MAQPTRTERRPRTDRERAAYEEGRDDSPFPWLWILIAFAIGILFGLWPVEAVYTSGLVVGIGVLLLRVAGR